MKVRSKRTTWLTVARMPIGSHHELSNARRSGPRGRRPAAAACPATEAWRAPPGPCGLTSRIAQLRAAGAGGERLGAVDDPAAVDAPSRWCRSAASRRARVPAARRSRPPRSRRASTIPRTSAPSAPPLARPSSSTSELTCPSQQRASDRSALASSLVIIQSVKASPRGARARGRRAPAAPSGRAGPRRADPRSPRPGSRRAVVAVGPGGESPPRQLRDPPDQALLVGRQVESHQGIRKKGSIIRGYRNDRGRSSPTGRSRPGSGCTRPPPAAAC